MSLISQAVETRPSRDNRVFAYGFDAAGFPPRHESIFLGDTEWLEFIDFNDPKSIETADGVIIPQGIFEKIESRRSTFGPKTRVSVQKSSLLERERQVFNLLRAGKWVCFLVREVVDEVSQGMHLESINDTDLCKRILNAFNVGRRHRYHLYIDIPREVKAREQEFERYVRDYGKPTTVLEVPRLHPIERHILVELGDQAVGLEFDAQLFFLPFHPPDKNASTALSVAKTVVRAISEYRRSRIVEIPSWVDELRFKSEEELYLEINSLLEKANKLESQLLSWRDYKSILTTSGKHLRNKIVAILESVFDLKVDQEKNPATMVITDEEHRPVLLMETQSAEGNIDTDAIARIDKDRKTAGLPEHIPAVLFINCDMSVRNIAKRADAAVGEQVIKYAKDLNVLIVRTIDLLFLMRQLESDPYRRSKLIHLLLLGGGWLKADQESHRYFCRGS
jgi:hypothetical protein